MAQSGTAQNISSGDRAAQAVEFGASMREMRLAHNRELADVAATLKIRQVYLQAIEDGRFHDLPGPTYATGFVRAYADYLGLDLAEVMRRYREITGDQPAQGPLVPPSPVVEARLPTGFVLLIAAILALAAYGGWYYLTLDGRDPVEVVSSLPERIARMAGIDNPESDRPAPPPVVQRETRPPPAAAPQPGGSAPASAPRSADAAGAMPQPSTEPETTLSSGPDATTSSETVSSEPAPAAETGDAEMSGGMAASESAPAATGETEPEASAAPTAETAAREPAPPEEPAAETPAAENSAAESAPASSETPSEPAQAEPAPMAVPEPAPAEAPAAVPAAPQMASAPEPPAAMETGTGGSASEADSRVVLRASAITWVELRDASGKRLYSRLMKRGETYAVPSGRDVVLETGNAGGLDILVDGTAIPSLGPAGAVRRGVSLDPEALLARAGGTN